MRQKLLFLAIYILLPALTFSMLQINAVAAEETHEVKVAETSLSPQTLVVDFGNTVSITFSNDASDSRKLVAKNAIFTTGMIAPGDSEKVSFTASQDFAYEALDDADAVLATGEVKVKPAAPKGLVATAVSSARIDLAWTNVANATSYQVYRNNVLVDTVNSSPFRDESLAANTSYSYKLKAVNTAGVSPFSDVVSATTLASVSTTPTVFPTDTDEEQDLPEYVLVNGEKFLYHQIPSLNPDDDFTIYGLADVNAEVELTINPEEVIYTSEADDDGVWFAFIDLGDLEEGDHDFVVSYVTTGGETITLNPVSFRVNGVDATPTPTVTPEPEKSNSVSMQPAIIVLVLLLLGVVGGIAYYVIKNKKKATAGSTKLDQDFSTSTKETTVDTSSTPEVGVQEMDDPTDDVPASGTDK